MKPVTIGGQIFYREKLDTYEEIPTFDKDEKLSYTEIIKQECEEYRKSRSLSSLRTIDSDVLHCKIRRI